MLPHLYRSVAGLTTANPDVNNGLNVTLLLNGTTDTGAKVGTSCK